MGKRILLVATSRQKLSIFIVLCTGGLLQSCLQALGFFQKAEPTECELFPFRLPPHVEASLMSAPSLSPLIQTPLNEVSSWYTNLPGPFLRPSSNFPMKWPDP